MNKSQKKQLRKAGRLAIVIGAVLALILLVIGGIVLIFRMFSHPAPSKDESISNTSQTESTASLSESFTSEQASEITARLNEALENYYQSTGIDKEDLSVVIETTDGQIRYALNEDEPFIAASLFKLPLAMLYCDMMAEGQFGMQDVVYFEEYDLHEEGDNTITEDYSPGDEVPVETAMKSMLRFSDNTAAAILYNNIGGWNQYLEEQKVYQGDAADSFENPENENLTTGRQMMNVLQILQANPEKYEVITSTLAQTTQSEFLNAQLPNTMIQKYGDLGEQLNAAGFSATGVPYRIVVLSHSANRVNDAGEINEIVWNILNGQDAQN